MAGCVVVSAQTVDSGWLGDLCFGSLQTGDVLAAPLWFLVGKGDGTKLAVLQASRIK